MVTRNARILRADAQPKLEPWHRVFGSCNWRVLLLLPGGTCCGEIGLPAPAAVTERPTAAGSSRAKGRRRIFVKQAGVFVGEAFELYTRNFLPDETLDGGNLLEVLACHDGKCVAHAQCTAGAADAMNIVFGMVRHVEVNDMADLLDIDAARGDIGGDHHFVTAIAKAVERLLALALRAVGVKHSNGMVLLMQPARHTVGAVFGTAKNQHLIVVGAAERLFQERLLLLASHGIQSMSHRRGRGTALADIDGFRVPQHPFAKLLNLG